MEIVKILKETKDDMKKANELQQKIISNITKIRSYYKHQNEHTSSLSESLIVSVSNKEDFSEDIYEIEQFIQFEEE